MSKIILDSNCKNEFMSYAMRRASQTMEYKPILNYFDKEKVSKLYNHFAKGGTYCNDKGEFWLNGDKEVEISTRITFPNGDRLDLRKDIIAHEKEYFKNNYNDFREENLFHWVWCNIERILRVNYYDLSNDWDIKLYKRIFKTA